MNTESSEELVVEESLDPELTSLEVIEAEQNTETSPITENSDDLLTVVSAAEASENVEQIEETQDVAEVTPVAAESETVTPEPAANELVMQFSADC